MNRSPLSVLKCNRTFVLRGSALAALDRHPGRKRGALKIFLLALGEYCFENFTDGFFNAQTVKCLVLGVQARTAINAYLPALVDCGAVLALDDGGYAIAGYHEYNPRAADYLEAMEERRAHWRGQKAAQRSLKSAHIAQCVQARPEKSVVISRVEEKCPHQPTIEPTPPGRMRSETNRHTTLARTVPEVGSPGEKQTRRESITPIKNTIHDLFEQAAASQRAYNAGDLSKARPLSDEELVIADELAGHGIACASPKPRPKAKIQPPAQKVEKLPPRLARMPKTLHALTEHDVTTNIMQAMGELPSWTRIKAFQHHLDALGSSRELLEYARRETCRQQSSGKAIKKPLSYMLSIVDGQKRAQLGMVT